ncbi:MAG: flagellar export protein FliJ [Magnetococcus sp. DMHC-8]
MNRFDRLVELRRIREEIQGTAFARLLARLEGLKQDVRQLDQQTTEEQAQMRLALDQGTDRSAGPPLPLGLLDKFLQGQAWRRKRLEQMIVVAQQDLEKARATWIAARTQLQQAEKLAEKEAQQQRKRLEYHEKKAMDMVGVLRNKTFVGQEGEVG